MKTQDYSPKQLIEGVRLIDLDHHYDCSGEFVQLGRLGAGINSDENSYITIDGLRREFTTPGIQVNYSKVAPKAIKGFHLHLQQNDLWSLMPGNKAIVNLIDARSMPADRLDECSQQDYRKFPHMRIIMGIKPQLLFIPKGVLHGISNPSQTNDIFMLYFVDQFFTGKDEFRVDYKVIGQEIWEIQNG